MPYSWGSRMVSGEAAGGRPALPGPGRAPPSPAAPLRVSRPLASPGPWACPNPTASSARKVPGCRPRTPHAPAEPAPPVPAGLGRPRALRPLLAGDSHLPAPGPHERRRKPHSTGTWVTVQTGPSALRMGKLRPTGTGPALSWGHGGSWNPRPPPQGGCRRVPRGSSPTPRPTRSRTPGSQIGRRN